jgi:hypothetical protein
LMQQEFLIHNVQSPALLVDSEPQLWTAGVSST